MKFRELLLSLLYERDTVHFGHQKVDEHNVCAAGAQVLQRVDRALRAADDGPETAIFDQQAQDAQNGAVVINEIDAHGLPSLQVFCGDADREGRFTVR